MKIAPYLNKNKISKTGLLALVMMLVFPFSADMAISASSLQTGDIIKCGTSAAIYYIGSDGQKHQFRSTMDFNTWGLSLSAVKKITTTECRKITSGSFVPAAPGSFLIKQSGTTKVYAIAAPNVLRHISSPLVAKTLYGANWAKGAPTGPMRVINASAMKDFVIGEKVASAEDYSRTAERAKCEIVNDCIKLAPISSSNQGSTSGGTTGGTTSGAGSATGGSTGSSSGNINSTSSTSAGSDTGASTNAGSSTDSASGSNTGSTGSTSEASSGSTALGISDASLVKPVVSMALPALGQRVTDPTFGTTIRRITNLVSEGGRAFHTYSQLQAFSENQKYVLLAENGDYLVRRMDNLNLVYKLPIDGYNAPRWQPAYPSTLVFYNNTHSLNPNVTIPLKVQYVTIGTNDVGGAVIDHFTFPSNYGSIRSNQSWDELSRDGRWMSGLAFTANNKDQILFAVDLQNKTISTELSLNTLYSTVCSPDPKYGIVEPDWVGVSPLGKYMMVQWKRDGTDRCNGLEAFDIKTGTFVGRAYDSRQHGDLGIDSDGVTEYFITFGMNHPSAEYDLGIAKHILPGPATGSGTPIYLQGLNWGNADHISCQGPNGVCLITSNNGGGPFSGELWLQFSNGQVRRLTHHRSSGCGYWVQPHGSISSDGSKIIYSTDWGNEKCVKTEIIPDNYGAGDAFTIEIQNASTFYSAVNSLPAIKNTDSNSNNTNGQNTNSSGSSGSPSGSSQQVSDPRVGTVQSLPASTYNLSSGESITMSATGANTFYVDPRIGSLTNLCSASDFIKHEVYLSENNGSTYSLIGSFTAPGTGQFSAGSSVITNGCAKDRLEFTVRANTPSFLVTDCITNAQNTSQTVCQTLSFGSATNQSNTGSSSGNTSNTGATNNSNASSGSNNLSTGGSALPSSTFTTGSETVSLRLADSAWFSPVIGSDFVKIALNHAIGSVDGSCDATTQFTKYELYLSDANGVSYSSLGSHVFGGSTAFIGGTTKETSGECNKGTFVYKIPMSSGAHKVGVCIVNNSNSNQKYCTSLDVSTQ